MISLYIAAREEGKYRALGGHKARPSMQLGAGGRTLCGVCNRPLTWNEERHAPVRRHR